LPIENRSNLKGDINHVRQEGDFFKERFYQKRWRNRFRIGLYSRECVGTWRWIDAIMMSYNYRLMAKDEMKKAVDACAEAG
jgi:hypothetical protein